MFSDFFINVKTKISKLSEHNHRRNRNIYDVFRGVFKPRRSVAIVVALMFSSAVTVSYASPRQIGVTVIDGINQYELITHKTTVSEALSDSGVVLRDYDRTIPALDESLSASQTIVVQRLKKVSVTDGGESMEYFTDAVTVGEFLSESGLELNYHDVINVDPDEVLVSNMELEIVRVVKRLVKINTEIPFETKTVADTSMSISDSKIITEGQNGIDCQTYEVIMHNGVEISRELTGTERIKEPVDQVKAVGTMSAGTPVKEKTQDFSYSRVINCNATAYDLSFQSCGKRPGDRGYGITASGTQAKYGTVAVDPRVIPLGTRMYIESADGSFVYGYCVAEDTGGAIKGNKVDLFFNTNAECMQFGRRNVVVYILD